MTDNYFTRLIGGAALACWTLVGLFLFVTLVWEPAAINAALGCAVTAMVATVLRVKFWWEERR